MAIYSGFSHQKWWFSIVMLVYQRVKHLWHIWMCLERGYTPNEIANVGKFMIIQWMEYTMFRQLASISHILNLKKHPAYVSWNIYQHLHHKTPCFVGTYTKHMGFLIWLAINPIPLRLYTPLPPKMNIINKKTWLNDAKKGGIETIFGTCWNHRILEIWDYSDWFHG